ncbi:PAS domain S-box-containing protein/diguanylate cyclase (GGDEF) domain-containing protein [Blastococcus aggregatus]|uniref:PAS domain S-box-containing protein/diguanylate cyclase (GGDEF) domain-containing protein n=1 Tax=Blastococcus aggregatus TaxID=38502 RepID=A0A285VDL1_9ACTN|nr:sensor domain-containing diguanylate cyclase [Blastococcus aggregatus]SOC52232.1 PAS domain S-box-containing protein/diguanylate cyclase (GGDEF) domain-containing protein [Blastococcus aggregatus]
MVEVMGAFPPADRRSAFANAPVGLALTTPDGVLVDVNPAFCALLERTGEELYGTSLLDLIHPEGASAARVAHADLLADTSRPMRHETRLVRAGSTVVPVQLTASWVEETPEGQAAHLVVIVEDITERKALEAQLVHRSLHDPLTGLPNRLLFQDRLWHALERGQRERTPTCVLIMDLDGFKAVNDELGHPMGDLVLVAFADRLRSVLRASDTAARLGGDEFSIVCENTDRPDAEVLAARLRAAVTAPLELSGHEVSIGISIGIGSAPGGEEPGDVHERVIRAADDAMYADKAARRRRGRPRSR